MKKITKILKKNAKIFVSTIMKNHWIVLMTISSILVWMFNDDVLKSVISVLILIFYSCLEKMIQIIEKEDDVPVFERRLTTKHKNGDISLKRVDLELATIYLSEVEDYIDRKGLRNE